MPRKSDRDRLLEVLDAESGLSNRALRARLDLGEERYSEVRGILLEEELVEKYQCRGGGLRLTKKGFEVVNKDWIEGVSAVNREKDLYPHLVDFLTDQSSKEEEKSVIFDTSSQRRKGTWQNPDVTQILIETYPFIRKRKIQITSYEIKQWQRWNESSVFEAASHDRAVHESILVLEWAGTTDIRDRPGRIPSIWRECERFGVGLATMEPFRKKFRMTVHLEPKHRDPMDEDIEFFLSSALEYDKKAAARFQVLMDESDALLKSLRQ